MSHYEYICVYVVDIVAASLDHDTILQEFRIKARYTLKGIGELDYYLGGSFGRIKFSGLSSDRETTCFSSTKAYIENIYDKVASVFDVKLRYWQMPMDPNYHSEVDSTPINQIKWPDV